MASRPLQYGLICLVLAGSAAAFWTLASRPEARPTAPPPVATQPRDSVACLGRLQPEDGIVRLAARSLMGQPTIVADVLVQEGDPVHRGQVVAVLNSRDQLQAAWQASEAGVAVANARVAQVKAGAKPAHL